MFTLRYGAVPIDRWPREGKRWYGQEPEVHGNRGARDWMKMWTLWVSRSGARENQFQECGSAYKPSNAMRLEQWGLSRILFFAFLGGHIVNCHPRD